LRPAPVNRVQLTARVAREPELRYLPSGVPLVRMPLEFDRVARRADGMQEKVIGHIAAVVTGPEALQAQERLRRGGEVYVEGQLQAHSVAASEGMTRTSIEIRVEHLEILAPGPQPEPELPLETPPGE
jgi:single-strand DNA-binding protein